MRGSSAGDLGGLEDPSANPGSGPLSLGAAPGTGRGDDDPDDDIEGTQDGGDEGDQRDGAEIGMLLVPNDGDGESGREREGASPAERGPAGEVRNGGEREDREEKSGRCWLPTGATAARIAARTRVKRI